MPTNKHALIRYRTIDRCLRNRARKWTLNDLIEACSDALYEYEGKDTDVSKRTVQLDLQLMRSDKMGYEAPIEVYQKKYYRYADPDYSITAIPLTETDLDVLGESVTMLRQFKDFSLFAELNGVIQKLEDKIYREAGREAPIIHLDKNENLRGLEHLDTLYQAIRKRIVLRITYRSFAARKASTFSLHGFILREFNNRWFLLGRREGEDQIVTLALDRIEGIEPDLRTEYRRENFDAATYYRDTYGVSVLGVPPIDIELWVGAKNAPYVLTKPFHPSQQLRESRPDGSIVIQLRVHHNYEIERVLLGFGDGVRVIGPKVLRKRIQVTLRRALARYETDGEGLVQ